MVDRYAKRKPDADINTFETPKRYIRLVTHTIDSKNSDPRACLSTVVQNWKDLAAGWKFVGRPAIRDDVVLSTSSVRPLCPQSYIDV